jgi:hypothetical protein
VAGSKASALRNTIFTDLSTSIEVFSADYATLMAPINMSVALFTLAQRLTARLCRDFRLIGAAGLSSDGHEVWSFQRSGR